MKIGKKKKIKKYYIIIFIILLFLVVMFVFLHCFLQRSQTLSISRVVEEIFLEEGLSNCKIVKVADYSRLEYYLYNPDVTDYEIEKYIEDIISEMGFSELTDSLVKEVYGFDSTYDYKCYVKEQLIENKKIEDISSIRIEIMDYLINNSTFSLDNEQVVAYSATYISGYEQEAYLYGMDLEEYVINILKISMADFYQMVFDEGKRQIEEYLIIGAIYNLEYKDELPKGWEENKYYNYQKIENDVYSLFINAEEGY